MCSIAKRWNGYFYTIGESRTPTLAHIDYRAVQPGVAIHDYTPKRSQPRPCRTLRLRMRNGTRGRYLHSFLPSITSYLFLNQFFLEDFTLIDNTLMPLRGIKNSLWRQHAPKHPTFKCASLLTSFSNLSFLFSSSRDFLSWSISTSALLHSSFIFVCIYAQQSSEHVKVGCVEFSVYFLT